MIKYVDKITESLIYNLGLWAIPFKFLSLDEFSSY